MVHVEVDTRAIRGNLERLRAWLPQRVALMLVVKEDGYGHGLIPVAKAAEGLVDWLGVAWLGEGLALRKAGFELPVFLMIPPVGSELLLAVKHGFHLPVGDLTMLGEIEQAARRAKRRALVHIEVDTGMGRFGLLPEEAEKVVARLDTNRVQVVGVYSHLSSANGRTPEDLHFTRAQVWWFRKFLEDWEHRGMEVPWRHLANSAAVMAFDEATAPPLNMVRIGTAAYGYPEGGVAAPLELTPAARAWTHVAAVRHLPRSWPVGYSRQYVTPEPKRVAILAAGYGDGLRPELRRVFIHDQEAQLLGKLGMDTVAADVTQVERVRRGDTALLFGPGISYPDWICPVLVPVLRSSHRRWLS